MHAAYFKTVPGFVDIRFTSRQKVVKKIQSTPTPEKTQFCWIKCGILCKQSREHRRRPNRGGVRRRPRRSWQQLSTYVPHAVTRPYVKPLPYTKKKHMPGQFWGLLISRPFPKIKTKTRRRATAWILNGIFVNYIGDALLKHIFYECGAWHIILQAKPCTAHSHEGKQKAAGLMNPGEFLRSWPRMKLLRLETLSHELGNAR